MLPIDNAYSTFPDSRLFFPSIIAIIAPIMGKCCVEIPRTPKGLFRISGTCTVANFRFSVFDSPTLYCVGPFGLYFAFLRAHPFILSDRADLFQPAFPGFFLSFSRDFHKIIFRI